MSRMLESRPATVAAIAAMINDCSTTCCIVWVMASVVWSMTCGPAAGTSVVSVASICDGNERRAIWADSASTTTPTKTTSICAPTSRQRKLCHACRHISTSLIDQFVADAAHGLNEIVAAGLLDLAAHLADVDVDDAVGAVEVVAPDAIDDLLAGEHASGVYAPTPSAT